MTRLLSELLAADEPAFTQRLQQLEAAHGRPSHDVRLSAALVQSARQKLQQLGLDPADTTPGELYHALDERLKADDRLLEKTLRTLAARYVSAEARLTDGMLHALQTLPVTKSCFALKTSVLRQLLKQQPPKRTMKQLGYRSLASMIKHEPAISLLAAAFLCEGPVWQRHFAARYERLRPADFETRPISIITPEGSRWQDVAEQAVAANRHSLLSFVELGAIVLLPLPAERPAGTTMATMVLALQAVNAIRAGSTFLKLSQVRGDFGRVVQAVAANETYLQARLLDQTVPWQLLQRFYARHPQLFSSELFEPHIQPEDLSWHAVEDILAHIEPGLAFWRGTAHLGYHRDHQAVSLNLLDVALNHCNRLPYASRLVHYLRADLWHELQLAYLQPSTVEQAIAAELQPQLATEGVFAS